MNNNNNESTIGADASVHACVHLWIANSIQFTCFHIEKKTNIEWENHW